MTQFHVIQRHIKKSIRDVHQNSRVCWNLPATLQTFITAIALILILIFQVGTWNEKTGVNFTRNFTESYTEIVESLQNKTLIVTTIYVTSNMDSFIPGQDSYWDFLKFIEHWEEEGSRCKKMNFLPKPFPNSNGCGAPNFWATPFKLSKSVQP